MKQRYIFYRRKVGGVYYVEDTHTKKQESLGTRDRAEAAALLNARNESVRQPQLNLQIAKAYLAGADQGFNTRTWEEALNCLIGTKMGANRLRWKTFKKDKALHPILGRVIIETRAEALHETLNRGTVSTNVFLRRLHNFCVDMNFLPWPLVPKKQWPAIRFKKKERLLGRNI